MPKIFIREVLRATVGSLDSPALLALSDCDAPVTSSVRVDEVEPFTVNIKLNRRSDNKSCDDTQSRFSFTVMIDNF